MAAVVASKVKRNRSTRQRKDGEPTVQFEYDRYGRLVPVLTPGGGDLNDADLEERRQAEERRRRKLLKKRNSPNVDYYRKVRRPAVKFNPQGMKTRFGSRCMP